MGHLVARAIWFTLLGLSSWVLVVAMELQLLISPPPSPSRAYVAFAFGHFAALLWTLITDVRIMLDKKQQPKLGDGYTIGVLLAVSLVINILLNVFSEDASMPLFLDVDGGMPQLVLFTLIGALGSLSVVLYYPFARETLKTMACVTIGSSLAQASVILLALPNGIPWNTIYLASWILLMQGASMVGWYLIVRTPAPVVRLPTDCDETVSCKHDELFDELHREQTLPNYQSNLRNLMQYYSSGVLSTTTSPSSDEDIEAPSSPAISSSTDDVTRRIEVVFNHVGWYSPFWELTIDRRYRALNSVQLWLCIMTASSVVLLRNLRVSYGGTLNWWRFFLPTYFGYVSEGIGAFCCYVSIVVSEHKPRLKCPTLVGTVLWLMLLVLVTSGATNESTGVPSTLWLTLSIAWTVVFGVLCGFAKTTCLHLCISRAGLGPPREHVVRVHVTWQEMGALVGSLFCLIPVIGDGI